MKNHYQPKKIFDPHPLKAKLYRIFKSTIVNFISGFREQVVKTLETSCGKHPSGAYSDPSRHWKKARPRGEKRESDANHRNVERNLAARTL